MKDINWYMKKYEFLEHPAELKVRSFGKTLPELFINSALAMMHYLYGDQKANSTKVDKITIEAKNLESLLVDWLAEILFLSDTYKRAYFDYQIEQFDEFKITADVGSIKALAKDDIKAVTYHELAVSEQNGIWQATVVYDI